MDSDPDPADPPDPPDPPDQVSGAAARSLPSTRAGGQDDVSSKQTPSNFLKSIDIYRKAAKKTTITTNVFVLIPSRHHKVLLYWSYPS